MNLITVRLAGCIRPSLIFFLPFTLALASTSSRAATVYVNQSAPGPVQDGRAWSTAFRTVQAGVNAAQPGDEVWVARGVYVEKVGMINGGSIYGGFQGSETDRSQRDWAHNVTVLDGGGKSTVVTAIHYGEFSLNPPAAIIDGFMIRDGLGNRNAGGVYVWPLATAVIAHDIITGNTGQFGGGIGVDGTATISDDSITGNNAQSGGGIYAEGTAKVVNATINGNYAIYGGAITGVGTTVVNSIVAFNSSGIYSAASVMAPVSVSHSDVFGNGLANFTKQADPTGLAGNISSDPLLSDEYHFGHLEPDSPCIDAGDDAAVLDGADIDGQARVQGPHVDMGSDEWDGSTTPSAAAIYHVSPGGSDANDGLSWATAKKTIGAAVSAAHTGDDVWLAAGTYSESVAISIPGVGLYGGFAGTETAREQRDPTSNVTILDGNRRTGVLTLNTFDTVIDGVTIEHCSGSVGAVVVSATGIAAISNDVFQDNYGEIVLGVGVGGIALITQDSFIGNYYYSISAYGTAVITDDVVTNNYGYGCIILGGTSTMSRVTISGNTVVSSNGSAALSVPGMATITDCTISNNIGVSLIVGGTATLSGCTVSGNTAYYRPNINITGKATLLNDVISGNSGTPGGIVVNGAGPMLFANDTIAANTGAAIDYFGNLNMDNCIVAFNDVGVVQEDFNYAWGTLSHMDLFGNSSANFVNLSRYDPIPDPTGTNGNISQDPLFVDYADSDFHLTGGSPCRDAGDDSSVTAGETDLDGKPRILGPHVDMGAYEYGRAPVHFQPIKTPITIAG